MRQPQAMGEFEERFYSETFSSKTAYVKIFSISEGCDMFATSHHPFVVSGGTSPLISQRFAKLFETVQNNWEAAVILNLAVCKCFLMSVT